MRHFRTHILFLLCTGVCFTVSAPAQTSQPQAAQPQLAQPPSTQPASLLEQSPQPPQVTFIQGSLTIRAMNSSLRAILSDIQSRAGTKVQGLDQDVRIFGVYGPGKPQAVLASLLDSSGYNVVIAGERPDGAPREVMLSPRSATPPPQPSGGSMTQAAQDAADDQDEEPYTPPQPVFAPPPHPRPEPSQPPANGAPQIRTPQQMLLELQRLRQQAQQQGQPGQQQSPQE